MVIWKIPFIFVENLTVMKSPYQIEFEKEMKVIGQKARANDPVIGFLSKVSSKVEPFEHGLRMLPFELVEEFGSQIIQDFKVYNKYYDPQYDVILQEWDKHYNGFWKDCVDLLREYQKPISDSISPMEIYNRMDDMMIRIERRALLLNPRSEIIEQKQTRLSGDQKNYLFIRTYWVDDKGQKKRMIARHIGERYTRLEREVADLFHNRGFAVHREYRSPQGYIYDLVIEREGMKTVVEVKMVNEEIFNNLFLFDELDKRFKEDYPGTP